VSSYTCAARSTGTLWCWGSNNQGQTGLGTGAGNTLTPTQVGTDTNWSTVATGEQHACATKTTGTLWCWGSNQSGKTGLGTTAGTTLAPAQVGTDTNWSTVDASLTQTCALKSTGSAWCWGSGAIGDGTSGPYSTPVQAGADTNWNSVATGWFQTCATKTTGALSCWGANTFLGLGNGYERYAPVVTLMPGLSGYTTPVVVRPAGTTLRLLVRVRFVNDGTTDGRQNTMFGESILLTHRFALVERAGGAV
jgi:alpha-tubulin suppressor-like RCC1 family protein